MSERIILNITQFNRRLITDAIEHGFTLFAVNNKETAKKIRELGAVTIFSLTEDVPSDYQINQDITIQKITSKTDELNTLKINTPFIIVETSDWKIIPLENLISKFQKRTTKIIAWAQSPEDAELLLTTLEHGVDYVLMPLSKTTKFSELTLLVSSENTLPLNLLEITSVTPVGMGERVCIDTCSILEPGEGMLIGSQSNGLFLVHNENVESPYADPRPFRVNAGAVHSYIRVPDGKTKYLSEIIGGIKVQIVNKKGSSRAVTVGRAKFERRPLLMINAKISSQDSKVESQSQFQVILQNAETIRLVQEDGQLISVVNLEPGNIVLGYVEVGGRHFGEQIEETINER